MSRFDLAHLIMEIHLDSHQFFAVNGYSSIDWMRRHYCEMGYYAESVGNIIREITLHPLTNYFSNG